RQERYEVLDGVLRIRFVGREAEPVLRQLSQRTGGREVEDEANWLENLLFIWVIAIGVLDGPWRLHSECSLKVGLGRLEVAKHQDRRPLRHGYAARQLAAGQRDRLRLKSARYRRAHGRQRFEPNACRCTGRDDDRVAAPERVLLLSKQVR